MKNHLRKILVVLAALLIGLGYIFWPETAGEVLLRQLGRPAGSTALGDLDTVRLPDGSGVRVSGFFQTTMPQASVYAFYERACWAAKLKSPPPKSIALLRPDLHCAGTLADGTVVGVAVNPQCAANGCEVDLAVELRKPTEKETP